MVRRSLSALFSSIVISGFFLLSLGTAHAGTVSAPHKGSQVSCKGEYSRYNMFTVNGISLKNGSCSKR